MPGHDWESRKLGRLPRKKTDYPISVWVSITNHPLRGALLDNLHFAPVVLLPLKNLMVLEAYNQETDQFLSWLEDHEVLPLSLA